MGCVVAGWKRLGRWFVQASPAMKAYLIFQVVGPLAIGLAVAGAESHDKPLLVAGLVLGGAYVLDTLLVWPAMAARRDLRRRARGQR